MVIVIIVHLQPKEIRKQKILKGLKITGIAILPLITGYTGYELGKVIN
ncbi:MAG: hypothetical protein KatS3mg002_1389 [Candidatus Woesearchaeota archaeon]|nr:MAG: hypothetical protein KatS3mg002_1389 [Candidatus Woesearchaeota archaeon]